MVGVEPLRDREPASDRAGASSGRIFTPSGAISTSRAPCSIRTLQPRVKAAPASMSWHRMLSFSLAMASSATIRVSPFFMHSMAS